MRNFTLFPEQKLGANTIRTAVRGVYRQMKPTQNNVHIEAVEWFIAVCCLSMFNSVLVPHSALERAQNSDLHQPIARLVCPSATTRHAQMEEEYGGRYEGGAKSEKRV